MASNTLHHHHHPYSVPDNLVLPPRRPGQDSNQPHCDLFLQPSSSERNVLLQLASLHRSAQVARFHWRQQHPHLDPASLSAARESGPATATATAAPASAGGDSRPSSSSYSSSSSLPRFRLSHAQPSATARSLAHAQRSDRDVYYSALNAAQSSTQLQQQQPDLVDGSRTSSSSSDGPADTTAQRANRSSTLLESDPDSDSDPDPVTVIRPRRPERAEALRNAVRGGPFAAGPATMTDRGAVSQRLQLREEQRQRRRHPQQHQQQLHSYAENETDWQCWDRLVKDLAPSSELREFGSSSGSNSGSGSSDVDETEAPTHPWRPRRTTLSGLAVSFLTHQAQNEMQSALHPGRPISLPHPIWSRRYKGPAGVWLRNELTRRSHAPSGERTAGATATAGSVAFPSLDPAQRRGTAIAATAAATVQAATQYDWSSFLVPRSTSVQSAAALSAQLTVREELAHAAALLARTAQSVEAHIQVSQLAHAARTRGLEANNTAATTYGTRVSRVVGNGSMGAAAGRGGGGVGGAPSTRSAAERPRSTRDAMAFLHRLRVQDGLIPGQGQGGNPNDTVNVSNSTNAPNINPDRSSPSPGTETPSPHSLDRTRQPRPFLVTPTFDPDGANYSGPWSYNHAAAATSTSTEADGTNGPLDPNGECLPERGSVARPARRGERMYDEIRRQRYRAAVAILDAGSSSSSANANAEAEEPTTTRRVRQNGEEAVVDGWTVTLLPPAADSLSQTVPSLPASSSSSYSSSSSSSSSSFFSSNTATRGRPTNDHVVGNVAIPLLRNNVRYEWDVGRDRAVGIEVEVETNCELGWRVFR